MPRKKKQSDYGTGIPLHEMEALAELLYPDIGAFFERPEVQAEFEEWLKTQEDNDNEGSLNGSPLAYICSKCNTNPNVSPIRKVFGFAPFGAGGGNRTRAASLEGWNSTIELHPLVITQPGAHCATTLQVSQEIIALYGVIVNIFSLDHLLKFCLGEDLDA